MRAFKKLVSQKYRTLWSDCTNVQADLALYWWQKLIIFGPGRIRVITLISHKTLKKAFQQYNTDSHLFCFVLFDFKLN